MTGRPLGYFCPTGGEHDGHTLIFRNDANAPWWCEDCRIGVTDEDLDEREATA